MIAVKARTMETRCHIAALSAGNEISTLFPTNARRWLPIMEDIAHSNMFQSKMKDMTDYLEENDEWHCISMDATMKVCLKLHGQAPHRMSKEVRDAAPSGDELAWRRLLTVRGRSGAVLLLYLLQDESATRIFEALVASFTQQQLASVAHVATDSPSEKLYGELRAICPALQSLMLDPTHLAIVYEYGFWNKKSSGSKQLRRILSKCCAVGPRNQRTFLGDLYNGAVSRPLTPSESEARSLILNCSMLKTEVDGILNNVDLDTPLRSRLEFIQCLAALCRRFSREVARQASGPNKEIFKIPWSACAPDRIEWLINNVRSRRIIPDAYLQLIPRGTAGNESLHAEINSWSKSTHALHRSTLAIRLRYYNYIKMLMHHLASKRPLSHIVTAQMLLGRSLHESHWTNEEWISWCEEQKKDGAIQKASLPLAAARTHETRLTKEWCAKRPATNHAKKTAKSKHSTLLTLKRKHTLRTARVKSHSKNNKSYMTSLTSIHCK